MGGLKFKVGRIILIDDDSEQLNFLCEEVKTSLKGIDCNVEPWLPPSGEVLVAFDKLIDNGATLVVTDYDLTKGASGFFGTSVVAWCQRLAIPVGDYSRGNRKNMPTEPSLFEFRFSSTAKLAAPQIAAIYAGFAGILHRLEETPTLLKALSPANMLAELLNEPSAVSAFSLYTPQVGTNSNLLELVQTEGSRLPLSAYVLGHLLFNSILKFPGPIVDAQTTCAYFACNEDQFPRLEPILSEAKYDGPFAELGSYYWRRKIDDLVDTWAESSAIEYTGHIASFRRALIEERIGGDPLQRFNCPRCAGELGGYRCPFTRAVVCERSDCSVGTSGWIPVGADLNRVERVFYDETAPMLGS